MDNKRLDTFVSYHSFVAWSFRWVDSIFRTSCCSCIIDPEISDKWSLVDLFFSKRKVNITILISFCVWEFEKYQKKHQLWITVVFSSRFIWSFFMGSLNEPLLPFLHFISFQFWLLKFMLNITTIFQLFT